MQYQKKHTYAAIAVTGLGPLMREMVRQDSELSADDQSFVAGYVRWAWGPLVCLLAVVGLLIAGAWTRHLAHVDSITIAVLVVWMVLVVVGWVRIGQDRGGVSPSAVVGSSGGSMMLGDRRHLLPGYNLVQRYRGMRSPYIYESIVGWSVVCIMMLGLTVWGASGGGLPSGEVIGIVLGLWIARVVSAVIGLELWGGAVGSAIRAVVTVHPEQLRACIKARILAIVHRGSYTTYRDLIVQEYSQTIRRVSDSSVWIEYCLFGIVMVWISWSAWDVIGIGGRLIHGVVRGAWGLVVRRYGYAIMTQQIPRLPMRYEVVSLVRGWRGDRVKKTTMKPVTDESHPVDDGGEKSSGLSGYASFHGHYHNE